MTKRFKRLTWRFFLTEATANHDATPTTIPPRMSNGQWTPPITRERAIMTKSGITTYPTASYPNRKSDVTKADQTEAWSEGKEASGTWFKMKCPALRANSAGRSIWTNRCMAILKMTAMTVA